MSVAHTPTPWSVEVGGDRGSWIKGDTGEWAALSCGDTDASAEANARFIVHAVNCHDQLVDALQTVWDAYGFDPSIDSSIWQTVLAAIAKALGRTPNEIGEEG